MMTMANQKSNHLDSVTLIDDTKYDGASGMA